MRASKSILAIVVLVFSTMPALAVLSGMAEVGASQAVRAHLPGARRLQRIRRTPLTVISSNPRVRDLIAAIGCASTETFRPASKSSN